MKMAGIVASTLRRRTFRQKPAFDTRYQAIDASHTAVSPTGSQLASRSSSFSKGDKDVERIPKATKLYYRDFWPHCVNPLEQNIFQASFETFDTLVPKANSWLQEHVDIHLVKCETVEKKVCSVNDVVTENPLFNPSGTYAIYVKGLRLWYVHDNSQCRKSPENVIPIEIGYMNVIPKCLDSSGKYPLYENLPDTYEAINAYLSDTPMEGRIVSIETVSLKLPHRQWDGAEVDPDRSYFPDQYHRHLLYITRIFFIYGPPEEEFIGAQDFLPDFLTVTRWYTIHGFFPKYRPLSTAMEKVKKWLSESRNGSIKDLCNDLVKAVPLMLYRMRLCCQCMFLNVDFAHVHTGVNFIDKVESCVMIRFLRVTYVRPQNSSTECLTMYSPPAGFSYKTFVPAAVKVGMCSGSPEYEPLNQTWERAKAWLKCIDRRVIGVETFYHTLSKIWHEQDLAESSVMSGEWTSNDRGQRRHKVRRCLVHVIRVYLDGDFCEPQPTCLPPAPMVEEFNDCRCNVM